MTQTDKNDRYKMKIQFDKIKSSKLKENNDSIKNSLPKNQLYSSKIIFKRKRL